MRAYDLLCSSYDIQNKVEDADELRKYISGILETQESESVENYMNADGAVAECFADMREVLSLDDRAVQRILREVDTSVLIAALEGSDTDVRKKILRNISQRAAMMLIMDVTQVNPNAEGVKMHVAKLLEIIANLKEAGVITSLE